MAKALPVNRTTAILVLVAVAVTVYALKFESGRQVFSSAAEAFENLDPPDIISLEITRGAADEGGQPSRVILERRGEFEWDIKEPVKFRGFVPRIKGILWEIADMINVGEVPPDAEDAATWCAESGPQVPDVTVSFTTRKGRRHTIEVGRQLPGLKDDVYVRIGGEAGKLIITRSSVRTAFAAGLEDLRSIALVPVAPVDCTGFSISGNEKAQKSFLREEKSGSWRFAPGSPLAGLLADRLITEDLLTDLNSWKIKDFVQPKDATPDFLRERGLDTPRLELEVVHRRGDRIKLAVGNTFSSNGEEFTWLHSTGDGIVFSGAAAPVQKLLGEAEKFRTQKVFDFSGVEFAEVRCRGGGGEFVLKPAGKDSAEGAAEGDPGGWLVESPGSGDSFTGDGQVVPEALAELRSLLIRRYIDPPATAPQDQAPLGEITVMTEAGQSHTLRILHRSRDPLDEKFNAFVAERSGDSSRFLIFSKWPGRAEFGAEVFRERSISQLDPRNVAEVVVSRGKTKWALAFLAGTWSFGGDQVVLEGKKLDDAVVNKVISALERDRFRVVGFAPGLEKESYEALGIGTHDFHLRLQLRTFVEDGEHKGFRVITLGSSQTIAGEKGFHYGRVDSFASPFLLDSNFPALLEKLAAHLSSITGER